MINPTIGNQSQFTTPFDILPNVLYTNPTLNNSQFTAPFDTLPNPTFPNPTFKKIVQPINYGTTTYSPYKGNPIDAIQSAGKVFKPLLAPEYVSTFRAVNDMWVAPTAEASNITNSSLAAAATGFAASSVASLTGIPQVSQVANSLINLSDTTSTSRYATLTLDQMRPIPGVKYADFRNRRAIGNAAALSVIRLDGAAAVASLSGLNARTAVFAAASANPLGGAYAVFNLDGFGFTGYGWGSQDDPYAIRNDFTLRSHIVKRWKSLTGKDANGKTIDTSYWKQTTNGTEIGVPFRGDRVSVIDFSQRTEKDAYKWNPRMPGELGNTQDFIKFYFTGPKLRPGLVSTPATLENDPNKNSTDDVLVFRAAITDISDTFNAEWSNVTMIGRGDKNYQYTGFDRDLQLSFRVHATDRDELQPIWRKLNVLASYTTPIYNGDMTLGAPWMRITIGDLFRQTPVVLTSLSYTLHDTDSTWEINIENADYMMQVPHRVDVKCTFNVIGNELPQKGGKMYSLAKYWDNQGAALKGNHNWLSDLKENSDATVTEKDWFKREKSTQQGETTTQP